MLIFAMVVMFSISCPLITPFGCLYFIMKHFVDKYNIGKITTIPLTLMNVVLLRFQPSLTTRARSTRRFTPPPSTSWSCPWRCSSSSWSCSHWSAPWTRTWRPSPPSTRAPRWPWGSSSSPSTSAAHRSGPTPARRSAPSSTTTGEWPWRREQQNIFTPSSPNYGQGDNIRGSLPCHTKHRLSNFLKIKTVLRSNHSTLSSVNHF